MLRIAAVIALVIASSIGTLLFDNRADNRDQFAINAPEQTPVSCSLPLRSREELVVVVTDIKQAVDQGTAASTFQMPTFSIFGLMPAGSADQAESVRFLEQLLICARSGVHQARIEAVDYPGIAVSIASMFDEPNRSVDDIVDLLMEPTDVNIAAISSEQERFAQLEVFIADGGTYVAASSRDMLGNAYAYGLKKSNDTWMYTGGALIDGAWASLNWRSNRTYTVSCPQESIRSDQQIEGYLQGRAWAGSSDTLIAQIPVAELGEPVGTDDRLDVKAVIADFTGCLRADVEPYRFEQGSEAFFGYFATYAEEVLDQPLNQAELFNPLGFGRSIPAEVVDVVSLGENRALATLTVNPEWESTGMVPGIILVKENGAWLIDQLALVAG